MKKKANAYSNLDFRMYPFSSCSLRNFWSASSSSVIVGMILQSIALGAPSLSSIAWSHGLDGGNRWASSSLKTFQCFWYSSRIYTLSWYCQASCASLLDMVAFREHSSSRFSTIWTLSHSDRGSEMVRDMVSWFSWVSQSRDRMMIGRWEVSITPLLQLNLGSKFASQGYPKIRSSFPRSMIRNLILFCFCPVWTLRST